MLDISVHREARFRGFTIHYACLYCCHSYILDGRNLISTKMQYFYCRDVDTEFLQNPPVGYKIITERRQVSIVVISINVLHIDITEILSAQTHLNRAPKTQYFAFHLTSKLLLCILSLFEGRLYCYRKWKECKTVLLPKMHALCKGV
jgi:hypothetical protein